MSSASDLVAALRAASARAAAAHAGAIAARARADGMLAELQQATHESNDERPADAVVRPQQARVRLDEAIEQLGAGDAALEEYIDSELGGAGTGTSTTDTGSATTARRPPFKPMRTDPAKRDEIAPHVGKDYAVATLWDEHGNRVVGLHSADTDGPAAPAWWREPWGSYPRLRRHVEAHAAARMHRDGYRHMATYKNLPPRKYLDGCDLVNVRAFNEALAQLVEAFEGTEVEDLEAFAAELGVTPPDDREGWRLTYVWGPNGEDLGLTWYQPADEPLTRLDY